MNDLEKTCRLCGKIKPIADFYRNPEIKCGYVSACKVCKNQQRNERRHKNPSRTRKEQREWLLRKDNLSDYYRRASMKQRFGMTPEDYQSMLEAQNGFCAICQQPESIIDSRTQKPRNLAIDHCHKTGRVRGLLCFRCNTKIAPLFDDETLLSAALAYIAGQSSPVDVRQARFEHGATP